MKKKKFKQYLWEVKYIRDNENYSYTDEDFETHKNYIRECWLTDLSAYKCLEFMYFETDNELNK